jgi:hypothetical protein
MDATQIVERSKAIYGKYFSATSNYEVNVDAELREKIRKALDSADRYIFDEAQAAVLALLEHDSLPKFLKSDIYRRYKENDKNSKDKASKQQKAEVQGTSSSSSFSLFRQLAKEEKQRIEGWKRKKKNNATRTRSDRILEKSIGAVFRMFFRARAGKKDVAEPSTDIRRTERYEFIFSVWSAVPFLMVDTCIRSESLALIEKFQMNNLPSHTHS